MEQRQEADCAFPPLLEWQFAVCCLSIPILFCSDTEAEVCQAKTLPGLSYHINPGAMQVFNFSTSEYNIKLASPLTLCGDKVNSGTGWIVEVERIHKEGGRA